MLRNSPQMGHEHCSQKHTAAMASCTIEKAGGGQLVIRRSLILNMRMKWSNIKMFQKKKKGEGGNCIAKQYSRKKLGKIPQQHLWNWPDLIHYNAEHLNVNSLKDMMLSIGPTGFLLTKSTYELDSSNSISLGSATQVLRVQLWFKSTRFQVVADLGVLSIVLAL